MTRTGPARREPVILLLALLALPAAAQPPLTGYAETYAGVRALDAGDVLAARTRARVDLGVSGDRTALALRTEATYDLLGDSLALALREAYADVFFERVDVRVGRQLLVWGETDGAFVTDLLSPLDLTEFLAQEPERLRLGVVAAKATAYLGDVVLDGVWMPVSPVSALPPPGSPWDPAPPDVLGVPVVRTGDDRPEARLATSEVALRLTWTGLPRTDLAVLLHDGTDRLPGFAKRPDLSLLEGLRIAITPTYRRRTAVGVTVETVATDPFIVRGEAAYLSRVLFDEAFPTSPFALLDPGLAESVARGFLVERPQVQATVALERTFGTHLVRAQGLGRWILDHDARVAADAFRPTLSALWTGTFRRETLTARTLAFWSPGEDLWLNPSLTYAVRDAVNLEVGAQVFEALGEEEDGGLVLPLTDPTGAFALYDANDLVYARLRYSF